MHILWLFKQSFFTTCNSWDWTPPTPKPWAFLQPHWWWFQHPTNQGLHFSTERSEGQKKKRGVRGWGYDKGVISTMTMPTKWMSRGESCSSELRAWWGLKRVLVGISLVVQWLRICLAMQGTWVWSLVGELKSQVPAHHNYWVLAPQRKILHEATKIPSVPTKTQGSQINKVKWC